MILSMSKMKWIIDVIRKKVPLIKIERAACVILVIGIFALVFDYVRLHQRFSQFKRAHEESVVLVQQVKEIRFSLANVDKVLNRLNQFSSKLKMIARIPQTTSANKVAALNPDALERVEPAPVSAIKLLTEKIDLEDIQLKLKDIQSEAELQEKALAELDELYSKNGALLAAIPWSKPAQGYMTASFGFRRRPATDHWEMHEGLDIAAYHGSKVLAPADGLVEKAEYSPSYGRYIVIDHGYGLKTTFAHASKILVKVGQYVKRGNRIALVGSSGRARGTHLHYEVRLNGVALDPQDYMIN